MLPKPQGPSNILDSPLTTILIDSNGNLTTTMTPPSVSIHTAITTMTDSDEQGRNGVSESPFKVARYITVKY
jgi:hypothetical protein